MSKNLKPSSITVRDLRAEDCLAISAAFAAQGWDKPAAKFETYFQQASRGERRVLIAEHDGTFAGYANVVWESDYKPFREMSIPEITDLNVLLKFRRLGIATALLDEAERAISAVAPVAGIRVGADRDYGAAQRLYAVHGYVPDGRGLLYKGKQLKYGDKVVLDNDLTIALAKVVA